MPPTVEAWSPNHWTTRKGAHFSVFNPSSAPQGSFYFSLSLDWSLTSLTVRTLRTSSLVLYLFNQSPLPSRVYPSSSPRGSLFTTSAPDLDPRPLLPAALLTFLSLQRPEPGRPAVQTGLCLTGL